MIEKKRGDMSAKKSNSNKVSIYAVLALQWENVSSKKTTNQRIKTSKNSPK
jgi:hypothetical protein